MDILSNFSETLIELFIHHNLNATEFSRKIAVDRSTISKYLNKKTCPSLPNAIIIADYFGCSLDYLFGITDKYTQREYKACPPFHLCFQSILKKNKCSRYRLYNDANFYEQTIDDWFHGKRLPSMDNIIAIANYFGCTIDELVGRNY